MPLDAAIGALIAVSAAAGAIVSEFLQTLWRMIRGIHITYEPI